MNDENAFQAALDAHPDDHTTRLVFADWLQERGDPRAEGYRILGCQRLYPYWSDAMNNWAFAAFGFGMFPEWDRLGFAHRCDPAQRFGGLHNGSVRNET